MPGRLPEAPPVRASGRSVLADSFRTRAAGAGGDARASTPAVGGARAVFSLSSEDRAPRSAAAPSGPPSSWVRDALTRRARDLLRDPRAWLVALAFVLRLLWVLLVPTRPVGDFALYQEAAEHLWDQGHLDSEFVYMPGYVFLLAAIRGLGGGLLATKMVGVIAGAAVAAAAGGISAALFGRRAAIVATALAAIWPAGVAVASVTGTDMPAAALGALGVCALVRLGPRRPWVAAAACGAILGLAAWVRAVAAPFAALSLLYWLAAGVRWPAALGRTAVAVALAFLVLLPWGVRNRRLYGELFFTDSHGGNTALVGANPNSEGAYSRSLNLMFTKGTGYGLFEPPSRHRQSDRAAFALAKRWTAFEPVYALGLVFLKADRLLTHERNLLYWPLFRQGVLDDTHRAAFDARRATLERATDLYWWILAGLTAAGIAVCAERRRWMPLSILVFPVALIVIYTLFFAEVRYHLAIVPLLIPYAAHAVAWALTAFGPSGSIADSKVTTGDHAPRDRRRTLAFALASVVALFAAWPAGLAFGTALRQRHRWAVTVCAYPSETQTHLCSWRWSGPQNGDSPVRGVWDGVGLRTSRGSSTGVLAAAQTRIPVGPGRFRVRAQVSWPGSESFSRGGTVALRADERVIARAVAPTAGDNQDKKAVRPPGVSGPSLPTVSLDGVVDITTSSLLLEVEAEAADIGSAVEGVVWISQLLVERF